MSYEEIDREKKLPPGMVKLCLTLLKWLDQPKYRDKVVKIVLTWLSSYYHDFELNPEFSYLFFRVLESRLLILSMHNQLHLLHVTLSTKSKTRHVTISRSSREQPLTFSISGGYEKNCGIFVTQVYDSTCDDYPYDGLMNYLKNPNVITLQDSQKLPPVPPRYRTMHNLILNSKEFAARAPVQLRPGDQILEVNGSNFSAIKLVEARRKLDMSTHLALTVKYNPSAFHEMRAVPEGKRKSSMSSTSSVSPYQPQSSGQNKFTFMHPQETLLAKPNDQYPPASPLFSSNANFGFRSLIKSAPKNDRSRLTSLINSSKQFVKHIRDSTVQSTGSGNIETMSKTSDSISDDQSNDLDIFKAKSNPDLSSFRSKEKLIESGLSNIVRLNELNPTAITDGSNSQSQALVNVLRVFNAANNEFRYLVVHEETTAREVVMVAVKEFNLTGNSGVQLSPGDKTVSSLNWHLYEVSVVPESRTIKQKCLSEQTSRLAERASLCSRLYIKNTSQSSLGPSRLDMSDDSLVNEILKESPASLTLTSLNATLLAVELTLADFDKFKSIEPQQFVYDTFFHYSESKTKNTKINPANGSLSDSASLKSSSSDGQEADILQTLNKSRSIPKNWMKEYQEFADISNKEMFWVVCEILNEKNISRRVKIVKQFVRVADVCSQLRNYNSMFAIISGLGHSCVNRLRNTFDKLKPKYKNQLEKMRSLFDPSKNMSNYRICLQQTPPPAIPLFPQIKKDLTFTKEGRSIYVREYNELSDEEDSTVCGTYSQYTIKRRVHGEAVQQKTMNENCMPTHLMQNYQTSISYTPMTSQPIGSDQSTILINFAEIRQFTDRVRNVIYFSSIPYSNDLLTNTKESQRSQAQIKKMHEEWQMRKRIRHYINQTLETAIISGSPDNCGKSSDQVDGTQLFSQTQSNSSKLIITYDERSLYQRSLDIEPEMSTRPTNSSSTGALGSERLLQTIPHTILAPILHSHPQAPPAAIHMHAPPSASNISPTLSKSSSLSSCSSFNHQLHGYHAARNNLTSSVGKFGTESTESLRKLQALIDRS